MPGFRTFLHNPIRQLGGPMIPPWSDFVVKEGIDPPFFSPCLYRSLSLSLCLSTPLLWHLFWVTSFCLSPLSPLGEKKILTHHPSFEQLYVYLFRVPTVQPTHIQNFEPLEARTSKGNANGVPPPFCESHHVSCRFTITFVRSQLAEPNRNERGI